MTPLRAIWRVRGAFADHNMDSTQTNVDDMHTWIDHVVATPAR
jgi:hypothetical protein